MAGALLEQAVEQLEGAGNPEALYLPVAPSYQGHFLEDSQSLLDAHNRRLRMLRNVVLFSALAAEAGANEFLAATLSRADAAAADRLQTVEKFVLGPRLAGHPAVLRRGAEPTGRLVALFKARDRLVHSKPGEVVAYVGWTGWEKAEPMFGPAAAVSSLVAVAQVIHLLQPLRPDRPFAWPAEQIWRYRSVLEEHVAATGPSLRDFPPRDGAVPPRLMHRIEERAVQAGESFRAAEPS
jgi:hypothetical protein